MLAGRPPGGLPSTAGSPLFAIALDAFARKDWAKCARFCGKVIAGGGGRDLRVLEVRSLAWLGLGKVPQALEDAHTIIRLAEHQAKGYLLAGKAFRASGAREAACKTYALALRKVPPSDPKYAELQAYHARLAGVPLHVGTGAAGAANAGAEAGTVAGASNAMTQGQQQMPDPSPTSLPSAHLFGGPHPLPHELVLRIVDLLTLPDRCRLCAVSRSWRSLLSHVPRYWGHLVLGDATSAPRRPPPTTCVLALLERAGSHLEHLSVARPSLLTDPVCTQLAKLRPARLRTLALPGCPKLSPKALALPFSAPKDSMLNLTTLHLAHSNADDRVLCAVLARCKDLRRLDLTGCDLVSDMAFLKHRPAHLRHLTLAHCQVSDQAVLACLPPPSLPVDGTGEGRDAERGGMRHLNLAQCSRITGALITSLAGQPLVELHLPGIRFGPDAALLEDGLLAWGSEVPPGVALRHLDLGSCPALSDLALDYVSAFHPDLQHLDLSTCVRLTDAGIRLLAQQCRGLRIVVLRACQRITDAGVQELLHHHRHSLGTLDVGNTRITAATVAVVVQMGRQLTDLCLRQTQVPVRTARTLAAKVGKPLARLDITGCSGYDYRVFADLAQALPSCHIISGDVQY